VLAVTEQLQALVGLRNFAEDSMREPLALASRWTGLDERSGIDRGAPASHATSHRRPQRRNSAQPSLMA